MIIFSIAVGRIVNFDKKYEEVLAFVLFCYIEIMFIFGLTDNLRTGIVAIVILSFVSLVLRFMGVLLNQFFSDNSVRPVTVGRRNWLYCDTTAVFNASMMVYSLLETAKANGLNLQKYLEDLFEARPNPKCMTWNLKTRKAVSTNQKT